MIELIPDSTIVYQWVMFMLAAAILTFGIFKPALRIINSRRSATEGDEARAEEFEQKIGELSGQVEASLDAARAEGQEMIASLRQEAEVTANQTIQTAREQLDTELKGLRGKLEQESKEVELQLKQHAQDLSKELAQRVLGRNIS